MNYSSENFTITGASANSGRILSTQQICAFSINVILGLPTHSYIIWLSITGTGSVASEIFNINLSLCEIGSCINCLFLICFPYLPILPDFLSGLGITGRPLFHCLICVERYLAVVHPVTFLKLKPLRYRVICCAVVWIITFGSCLSCTFILDSFDNYIWFFSLQFLVFLSIELFCCGAVLKALRQSGPGDRRRERSEESHTKRRAFCLILITTVTTLAFYVPFLLLGVFFMLSQQFHEVYFNLSFIFSVFISFVQPILYLYRVGKLSCLFSLSKNIFR